MRPPRRFTAGVVLLAVALLAACGTGGPKGSGPGRFSAAIPEPSSLLPANYSEVFGAQVVSALFTQLVTFDPETSDVTLAVAKSVESEDNRNWTVELKDGWTFHNGDPVTAHSFVNAWNFAANPKNAQLNSYVFDRIDGYDEVADGRAETLRGLKVVSNSKFTIRLDKQFSQFEMLLGYPAFSPLPDVAFQDPKAFNEAPIGNGPLKMRGTWVHDESIKLDRYDDYAGTPAKATGVDFRIYQEFTAAYNDLLAGNLDVLQSIPNANLSTAREQFDDRYFQVPSGRMEYLGFPLKNEKFANRDVRKAISMAVDRKSVTKAIFQNTRTPATGYVPPVVPGAARNPCGATCRFDPAAAKALFEEAGGIEGNSFTIGYSVDGDNKEWVEAVAHQISDSLDIDVATKPYEKLSILLDDLSKGKVDTAFRTAWTFYFPSVENYLTPIFRKSSGENFSGYYDADFERLLDEGNAATDPEVATQKYNEAERVLLDDMPYLPMWYQETAGAHSKRVSDVVVDPFRRLHVENVVVS